MAGDMRGKAACLLKRKQPGFHLLKSASATADLPYRDGCLDDVERRRAALRAATATG